MCDKFRKYTHIAPAQVAQSIATVTHWKTGLAHQQVVVIMVKNSYFLNGESYLQSTLNYWGSLESYKQSTESIEICKDFVVLCPGRDELLKVVLRKTG